MVSSPCPSRTPVLQEPPCRIRVGFLFLIAFLIRHDLLVLMDPSILLGTTSQVGPHVIFFIQSPIASPRGSSEQGLVGSEVKPQRNPLKGDGMKDLVIA